MTDYYHYYKSRGICVTCGNEPAKPGHVRCWRCLANLADMEAIRRDIMPEEQHQAILAKRRVRQAALRVERREQGLCPNCGRERKDKSYAICEKCRASAKRSAERKRRADGMLSNGLRGDGNFCAVCLKPVEKEGSKLCNRCAENNAKNILTARAAQNNENHPWRMLANGQYKLYMEKKEMEERRDRERI